MDTKEKFGKIKNVGLVIFVVLLIVSIIFLIYKDGMPWFPSFAALLFILTSVLAIICILCGFLNANGYDSKKDDSSDDSSDDASIERKYRFGNFLIVISVSLVVIYILSHIVANLINFDASDENVANFYTAFIALCTTFVVGFQIYSSLDLNKKIDKLDADKRSLEEELKKLSKVTKESEYYNAYTIGTIRYGDSGVKSQSSDDKRKYCWNALRAYFNALRLAAEGGHDFRETFDALEGKIRGCINALDVSTPNPYGPYKYYYDDNYVNKIRTVISGFIKRTKSIVADSDFDDLASEWEIFSKKVADSMKK